MATIDKYDIDFENFDRDKLRDIQPWYRNKILKKYHEYLKFRRKKLRNALQNKLSNFKRLVRRSITINTNEYLILDFTFDKDGNIDFYSRYEGK